LAEAAIKFCLFHLELAITDAGTIQLFYDTFHFNIRSKQRV